MPILNYTTKIEASKTAAEIQAMLIKHGATAIQFDYSQKVVIALQFKIETATLGVQFYSYSPDVEGVLRSMKRDPKISRTQCTLDQARRVAWRIEKNWLEAQFAKIEAMDIPLEKIMLPYMVVPSGVSLYEAMVNQYKTLPQGEP